MSSSIWSPGGTLIPQADPNSQVKSQIFVAQEGQTVFLITNFTYVVNNGALQVFVNGVKQASSAVGELSTTSFSIAACDLGDTVEVVGQTAIGDAAGASAIATEAAAAALVSENNAADYAADALSSANSAAGSLSQLTQFTGQAIGGDLSFTGTGQRIRGDFINATIANRTMLQNNTTGPSSIGVIGNGAGNAGAINIEDGALLTTGNSAYTQVGLIPGLESRFSSGIRGAASYLPITFYTSGAEKLRIAADATGTYNFGGTAPRITGDFSNATIANRVMFQTGTVNGNTALSAIPNGTGATSAFTAFNSSDPANAGYGQFFINGTIAGVNAGQLGTGTYLPMTFWVGGAEAMRIDTSRNVLVTGGGGLGYGTGSGGTVTQATSKATTVTLNKPTGKITTFNEALTGGAIAFFAVNNSLVSFSDVVILNLLGGANYQSDVYSVSAGIFNVRLKNLTGGSLSEAVQISFAIIKGVIS